LPIAADHQPHPPRDGALGRYASSVDDVCEILSAELLGIVPDDEDVIDTTNRGEPIALKAESATRGDLRKDRAPPRGRDRPVHGAVRADVPKPLTRPKGRLTVHELREDPLPVAPPRRNAAGAAS